MRDYPDSLMLFCAGFGTRMKALTKDRPKPLIEVCGKTLFDHALDVVKRTDLETIVVNTHYFSQMMGAHAKSRGAIVSDEADEILETGGGLKQALPLLGEGPVFTMNTDAVWKGPNPAEQLKRLWNPDKMDALLLLIDPDRAHGHEGGDFELRPDGQIVRGGPFIYSGLQIIRTDLLGSITDRKFSVSRLWDRFGQDQRLFGAVYEGDWCDVGHPDGIEIAEALLQS